MALRTSLGAAVLLLVVMNTALEAQGRSGNSTGLPQGKPFQQIQSQLDAVTQRIAAVETQVAALEAGLETELASINASVSALQSWAGTVDGALALLVAQGQANAAAIAALDTSIASLESALAGVRADLLTALTQGQLDAARALQDEAARLQARIDAQTEQITTLQGQMSSAQAFLDTIAGGTCAAGQAVADIAPTGALTCMTPSAGGVQVFTVQRGFAFSSGLHSFTATCPLGMVTVGGGYDGVAGVTLVGSFPTETAWVVRVNFQPASPLTFASVTLVAKCVPR